MSVYPDPGLQPERTTLAWGRTSLALVVTGSILLRWAHVHGPLVVILAVLTVLVSAVLHSTQRRKYNRMRRGIAEELIYADVSSVLWLCVGTSTVALGGLAVIWI